MEIESAWPRAVGELPRAVSAVIKAFSHVSGLRSASLRRRIFLPPGYVLSCRMLFFRCCYSRVQELRPRCQVPTAEFVAR
jgi:hypothetical protein